MYPHKMYCRWCLVLQCLTFVALFRWVLFSGLSLITPSCANRHSTVHVYLTCKLGSTQSKDLCTCAKIPLLCTEKRKDKCGQEKDVLKQKYCMYKHKSVNITNILQREGGKKNSALIQLSIARLHCNIKYHSACLINWSADHLHSFVSLF